MGSADSLKSTVITTCDNLIYVAALRPKRVQATLNRPAAFASKRKALTISPKSAAPRKPNTEILGYARNILLFGQQFPAWGVNATGAFCSSKL